jgi:putative transposase
MPAPKACSARQKGLRAGTKPTTGEDLESGRLKARLGTALIERDLLNERIAILEAGAPRGPRSHDGTIIPDTVDTMWGTDLTATFTGEGQAAVFIAVDHFTAECVGIHASSRATRFEALEPIRQGVRRHIGGFTKDIAHGLAVTRCRRVQSRSPAIRG